MSEDADDTLEDGAEEPPKKGKKGLIIIILLILLLGGAGAGAYFTGMLDEYIGGGEESEEASSEEAAEGEDALADEPQSVFYYNPPPIKANLNPGSNVPSFILAELSFEVSDEAMIEKLTQKEPKIQDIITTYMRELRPSDLRGSAGAYRLRDELLLRVNKVMHPDKINNILFKQLLIQ